MQSSLVEIMAIIALVTSVLTIIVNGIFSHVKKKAIERRTVELKATGYFDAIYSKREYQSISNASKKAGKGNSPFLKEWTIYQTVDFGKSKTDKLFNNVGDGDDGPVW